jgi:hypothetical protein
MVCIIQEAARLPDKKECRGYDHNNKPVQLSVGIQAVNPRRLGGHLDTVILFVVRGLRFSNGAFEDGFALVHADVERRLKPTIDLYGGSTLLIECRVHRVHKRPSKSNQTDRSWGTATEAFIEVSSTVCEDFDRLDLQDECRRVIGFDHKQCFEVNLSGHNFLYVLNTDCAAFDNNLPPACTLNWHGPLSVITMVRNDLTDREILGALWDRGVNINALERLVVTRGLAADSNGVWLDVFNERRQLQTERTTTAQLVWKKLTSGALQTPPEVTKDDLREICYCDAYRVARGTHSMALEEVGMQEMMEMQRVMVLSLKARGLPINFERAKQKIHLVPGGKTTLGRYQVNAFVPQGTKDTNESSRKLNAGGSGERTPRTPTTPSPMAERLNISQTTPRASPWTGQQTVRRQQDVSQVLNADGTGGQILINDRAPVAVGNGLMVRTNVEALIAAERSYTQSAISQALVPLQEENKALRDQLESMKGVQEKTVRAVNLQAQSSSAALAEMKAAQESSPQRAAGGNAPAISGRGSPCQPTLSTDANPNGAEPQQNPLL